jgi:hypothetical protein
MDSAGFTDDALRHEVGKLQRGTNSEPQEPSTVRSYSPQTRPSAASRSALGGNGF